MPSTNFNFTSGGANYQEAPTLTATAGDFIRVRFDDRDGDIQLFIHITNNGKETKGDEVIVSNKETWVSGGLMTGDVVKLSCLLNNNSNSAASGILEVGQ